MLSEVLADFRAVFIQCLVDGLTSWWVNIIFIQRWEVNL